MNPHELDRRREADLSREWEEWCDDDDEEDEICGYYCLSCGQDFDTPGPFHECPWCDSSAIDPIYF